MRVWLTDTLGHAQAELAAGIRLTFQLPTGPNNPPQTTPSTTPTVTTSPPAVKQPARLSLTHISRSRGRLTLNGTNNAAAHGPVAATFAIRRGSRPYRVRGRAQIGAGRFTITLRLPVALRAVGHGRLTVTYAGEANTLGAQTSTKLPSNALRR